MIIYFEILTITWNNVITGKALFPKQLIIVGFTISQATFLKMPWTIKWRFTLGACKMLNMPLFAQCVYNPLFINWHMTCGAYRDIEFIVTLYTIEFASVLAWWFQATGFAIKMVRMVYLAIKPQCRFIFNWKPLTIFK